MSSTKKFKDFAEDLNPEYATYLVGYRPTDEEEVRIPLALIGLGGAAEGKYIRKDGDDYANGNISFRQSIDIAANIRSKEYIQNAKGWFGDYKGNFEMNSLRLREFLETPELRKNRITVMQNEFWFTDSATVSEATLRGDGKYNIDFKLEEGEYVPFRAGDILKGIYSYDTGFYTVFLYVESLIYPAGDGAKSIVATSMNGRPPAKAMLLARMNNMVDPERQGSIFADGKNGYFRIMHGFDEQNPTSQGDFSSIKIQLGDLSKIQGHPAFGNLTGWGLYASNVYLTGRIVQTDWQGNEQQPLLYFKGLYSSVATYFPYDSVRYVDEAGKEGIYYVKLRDDILVTGIKGIPPTNEDYWELNQVGANGIDGRSLWSTYHDSITKPAKPTTAQGTDNGWHIQPDSQCMWMCQKIARTIEEGTWSEPIKVGALDGVSSDWKSYVFKLSETTPETPNSGVDSKPIPDGWLDAPTSEVGKWWMIVATVDGQTNQVNSPWSSPKQVTGDKGDTGADGSYTVYQFCKKMGETPPDPDVVEWFDNPPSLSSGEFLFMRMQTINPVIQPLPDPTKWSTPVRISGEKGEPGVDGVDGSFSEYVYCRSIFDKEVDSSENPGLLAIAKGLIEDPNSDYPVDSNVNGHVPPGWSADPLSVNESLQVGWIAKRYKTGLTWGRFSTPAINAKYGVDGIDGPGVEYIFFRYTSPLTLSQFNPNASTLPNKDQDGFVPTDIGIGQGADRVTWTNNPTGTTEIWLYEYVAKRTKSNGVWSNFTNPAIWSKYGQNGADGSGVEMVFKLTVEKINPGKPTQNSQDDGFIPEGWTDNASGASKSTKYEWMAKRRKLNNLWLDWEMPVVWSTYVIGDWISYAFKATKTKPPTPTDTTPIPSGWSDGPETIADIDGKLLPNWLTKSTIDGTSNVAGPWSVPVKVTGEDGEVGEDGTAVDYKYARNTSMTSYPSITRTQLNPSGWVDAPPATISGYYTWMTVARKTADGSRLLPQNGETVAQWSIPVRITGESGPQGPTGNTGSPGSTGPQGPTGPAGAGTVFEFMGNYVSKEYCWIKGRRPVVYYNNRYYAMGDGREGTCITAGWGSSEWTELNSFATLATGLFLAQTATIAGWYFSNNYIWSQNNNVLLDGRAGQTWPIALGPSAATNPGSAKFRVSSDGVLYATGANVSGTINADSGTFNNLTMSNITINNLKANSGTIGGLSISSTSMYGTNVTISPTLIKNSLNTRNYFAAGSDSTYNAMMYARCDGDISFYGQIGSAAKFENYTDRGYGIPVAVNARRGRIYGYNGIFDFGLMTFNLQSGSWSLPLGRKASNSDGDGLVIVIYSASYQYVELPTLAVLTDLFGSTPAYISLKLHIVTSNWGVNEYVIQPPSGFTLYDWNGAVRSTISVGKNRCFNIIMVITDEKKYYWI